jgi:ribosomal protein S27AE
MTGPIPKVTCPHCGGEYARRRDGAPYGHKCVDGVTPSGYLGRRRCARCGTFIDRQAGRVTCEKCGTVWEKVQ